METKYRKCILTGIFLFVVILIICVIATIAQCYFTSYALLQGVWHIKDNNYLFIDEDLAQIVSINPDGQVRVLKNYDNFKFNYRPSSLFHISHSNWQCNIPSNSDTSLNLYPFNRDVLTMELFESNGVMLIKDEQDYEVGRLVRDNEMSLAYLSN